ncbi:hypothetical protein [Agromyces archimandritae]|uniref:Uncharacterized protein n=1 Tax=Agromyces archimandritae TaxID=2781962 RepID=A0A975IP56_9MICO|nr:hypothetical protein [Agromyces archimandritae]QTX05302.1 hypothetical protein G127AT_03480 [Agromyces archimandritae]
MMFQRVVPPPWFLTIVATLACLGILTATGTARDAIAFVPSGFRVEGLLTPAGFEIVASVGFALLRFERHAGRSHQGWDEQVRLRAGSHARFVRRIVAEEMVAAGALAATVVVVITCSLVARFGPAVLIDPLITSPIAAYFFIGWWQLAFYSLTLIVVHFWAPAWVAFGAAALIVAVPPIGVSPPWLPLHQFNIDLTGDDDGMRMAVLVVATAATVALGMSRASKPRRSTRTQRRRALTS